MEPTTVQFEGTTLECKFWKEYLLIKAGCSENCRVLGWGNCVLHTLSFHWPHIAREKVLLGTGSKAAGSCCSVASDSQSAWGLALRRSRGAYIQYRDSFHKTISIIMMRSTIYSVPTQALLVHFLSQQGCATSITESGVKVRQGVSSSEAAGLQAPRAHAPYHCATSL